MNKKHYTIPRNIEYFNRVGKELSKLKELIISQSNGLNDNLIKNILQFRYPFGIDRALMMYENEIIERKTKFFKNVLDNLEKPYYELLLKTYEKNTYNCEYGLYHEKDTGVTDFNIKLCGDYAYYKLTNEVRL